MEINLTPDQQAAYERIMTFVKSGSEKYLTLGGYAGTGKTTLLGFLSRELKRESLRLAFCAFTGKAANVLRSKVGEYINVTEDEDFCGTIHSLIYKCVGEDQDTAKPIFVRHDDRISGMKYNLIIVDEASMVTKRMFEDLLHCGIKILAVGDHGQLGPVEGNFNLMEEPMIRLEKIMRQAEDSPIIQMSIAAREKGYIPHSVKDLHDERALKTTMWDQGEWYINNHKFYDLDSIMICGRNRTRLEFNERARSGRHDPVPGDVMMCLSNDYDRYVFNGSIGIVREVSPLIKKSNFFMFPHYEVVIDVDGFEYKREILAEQLWAEKTFGNDYREEYGLWTYGYCITCHKSQGSQWKNVIVIEEPLGETEDKRRRWIYTAVTRASDRLRIIQK